MNKTATEAGWLGSSTHVLPGQSIPSKEKSGTPNHRWIQNPKNRCSDSRLSPERRGCQAMTEMLCGSTSQSTNWDPEPRQWQKHTGPPMTSALTQANLKQRAWEKGVTLLISHHALPREHHISQQNNTCMMAEGGPFCSYQGSVFPEGGGSEFHCIPSYGTFSPFPEGAGWDFQLPVRNYVTYFKNVSMWEIFFKRHFPTNSLVFTWKAQWGHSAFLDLRSPHIIYIL